MAKAKANNQPIKTPSVLAFSRIIEPTDGYFYQRDSRTNDKPIPLGITKRSIRTTISNRQKPAVSNDREKMNAEIIKPNLQTPDICYLDENCNILVAHFGVKFFEFDGTATACNEIEYQEKIKEVVSDYRSKTQFLELAHRYATNIANARWLWRNRMVAKAVNVKVQCNVDDKPLEFNFKAKSLLLSEPVSDTKDVDALATLISQALRGEVFLSLYVVAEADIGFGHQVFPSQEMNLNDSKAGKELFQLNGIAGLHAPKIGNALRTIDTWYSLTDKSPSAISVELYGSVTNLGTAFRPPADKLDFYTIIDSWIEDGVVPPQDSQHYAMAMLIRGGVFGKSSK